MNHESCPPLESQAGGAKRVPTYGPFVRRAIWIVSCVTVLICLIFVSSGRTRLSHAGIELFATFIYSAFIGLPSIAILTTISIRFAKSTPRFVYLMQALVLVCTATAGTFAADLLLQLIGVVPRGGYWVELRLSLPFSLVISLMFGLSISTYETLRYRLQAATLELRTQQVEQERAYKLLAEARLSSLESRIHPHFLFNTLNSIAALIPSDPTRAEDTVGKLASLLRFSLNAQQSGLVSLSQELKIVRDYLEIEKTRFGQRIRYEIDVADDLQDVKVPPLALQSVVENAIKHVAAKRPQGVSIRVSGARAGDRIHLDVVDDGPGFSLSAITPEHGLGNIVGRLELLFGTAGLLAVTREDEKTLVRLAFPA